MFKKILSALLLSCGVSAYAGCTNPSQILYFDNSLLTRTCAWVDQVDLWRTTNTQYDTVFIGDSLIANGSWPGLNTANHGYGGDTVQLVLQRVDIAVNAHPTDVYMLIGINDFWRGADPTWIFSLYNYTISILTNAGINVHVISTIQCNPSMQGSTCTAANPKVKALNASLAGIVGIDFIDADALLSDAGGLKSMYTTDGIHLNSTGYGVIYGLL